MIMSDTLSSDEIFYLRGISKILEVLQHHQDLDALIKDVAKTTLELFQCDRVFLLYPLDPQGDVFRIPFEITKPEYPGALEMDIDIPVTDEQAGMMTALLNERGPLLLNASMMKRVKEETPGFLEKDFIMPLSAVLIPIFPRVGKPWAVGLHQCSYERQWNQAEQRLFSEISERLADALSSRLLLNDLRKSEYKYRRLVESLEKDYFLYSRNIEGHFDYISPSIKNVLGYQSEDFISHYPTYLTDNECNRDMVSYSKASLRGETPPPYRIEIIKKSGDLCLLEVTETPVHDQAGKVIAVEGIAHDITAQNRAEEEMHLSASVFEHTVEAIMVADKDQRILRVNRAFCAITGFDENEVIGKTPRIMKSGRQDKQFYKDFWQHLNASGAWRGELWNKRKDGSHFPIRQTVSVVKDGDTLMKYISVFSDITDEYASKEHINQLAYYDRLTNLPNRWLFHELCEHAITRAERHQRHGAVMFIDLDRFKHINDSLGHTVGDGLLQAVAKRLTDCLRSEDTVARLGGDEFTILLEEFDNTEQLSITAGKVLAAFVKSFEINGYNLHVTPSIGISIFPDNANNADALIQYADVSMYRAKESGGNRYGFYTPELTRNALARVEMEANLIQAIEEEQFEIHYQPQIKTQTGKLIGAEALIRWHHPQKGLVPPLDFIPLAEDTGLIIPIGEWVIKQVCQQINLWDRAGLFVPSISINVAGPQFYQNSFISFFSRCLQNAGLNPTRIEIEITETFIMQQKDRAIQCQMELKEMGAKLSIDDFGTGYSSLAQLKRLPISTLKIDKSFVRDIPNDPNDEAIVKSILAMAKTLNLNVVAEGVETDAQRQFLEQNDCDILQGYFISKPLPAEQFIQFITESNYR